VLRSFHNMN
jgi:DNA end-binding protein Ku